MNTDGTSLKQAETNCIKQILIKPHFYKNIHQQSAAFLYFKSSFYFVTLSLLHDIYNLPFFWLIYFSLHLLTLFFRSMLDPNLSFCFEYQNVHSLAVQGDRLFSVCWFDWTHLALQEHSVLGSVDVFVMYLWLSIALLEDAQSKTAGQGAPLKCE